MSKFNKMRTKASSYAQKNVSPHNFSEKQMRAYFTKNDFLKEHALILTVFSGILCLILADVWLVNFPLFAGTGLGLLLVSLIIWLLIKTGISVPTDEQYDAWVEKRVEERLIDALDEIGQDGHDTNIRERMIYVRGFILPSTRNTNRYRQQDLLSKVGRDGNQRYSINVYTYFLPAEHQLVVFIFHINSVNHLDRRTQIEEYFYTDIVAAKTEEEQDTIQGDDGMEHVYLTHSFALRINDGNRISVTIHSKPLDHEQGLETYEIPSSHVETTIRSLRWLLRSKKQGQSL